MPISAIFSSPLFLSTQAQAADVAKDGDAPAISSFQAVSSNAAEDVVALSPQAAAALAEPESSPFSMANFRMALGSDSSQAGFRAEFDFDGDGAVSASDLRALNAGLNMLRLELGGTGGQFDMNHDGYTSAEDLRVVMNDVRALGMMGQQILAQQAQNANPPAPITAATQATATPAQRAQQASVSAPIKETPSKKPEALDIKQSIRTAQAQSALSLINNLDDRNAKKTSFNKGALINPLHLNLALLRDVVKG
jgi:alpha-D-ribose 1-methylphosphonate 5-triphosphate synthase subunit PhnG